MRTFVSIFLLQVSQMAFLVMCFIPTDEQRLLDKLLTSYNPASRPVYNASDTVTVKFGLTLAQVSDMDEVNQVLTTIVWLEQEWIDERLRWNPDDFGGLKTLRMPCDKIWLPDMVLYNNADDFTTGYMQSKAMVSFEGVVFWPPPAKFRSSCKIDITFFPFDDQLCKMKFGSWTYDGFQVDVTNRSANVDLSNYIYSGEWDLIDIIVVRNTVTYACCIEFFPDVTFSIIMRRRTLYYLFNIIFPCLWLTVLSLLGFWLPPDSGEKITLGITVLLAFSVFMLLIAENMPATSEFVPLIGIYLTVTMGMTSLSIVLTVFVLQLHHVGPHQRGVPKWLQILSHDILASILCLRPRVNPFIYHSARKSDTCLSSYIDSLDSTNCNGIVVNKQNHVNNTSQVTSTTPTQQVHYQFENSYNNRISDAEMDETQDKITASLKLLVEKQDLEERHQDIVNEWRFVALIMDRFLFWLFLLAAVMSSVIILVVMPMNKPSVRN
ncbi:neuronal acetylcholine receptor subunit alpha-2-like isoform X1 [Mercenaria mercenaria]|uniref:neuronal acetylcholine receptor subunit alpha-2-like isoform X1 n=1 Tax=Mercenaria mercenaria TaxID=6596 RepID=UPI00234F95ED|nr:neuronal acetylcholine receptor subunit alpha-2-like isoform X1 [Mercenaria mercenaria]